MLTNLVEKNMTFTLMNKRRDVQYMLNSYCGTELNYDTDCCIGHSVCLHKRMFLEIK